MVTAAHLPYIEFSSNQAHGTLLYHLARWHQDSSTHLHQATEGDAPQLRWNVPEG